MSGDLKTLLGLLAVVMSVAAHIPYLWQTLKGTNHPHLFTWIIWTLLTGIAFAAQVAGNAGPGAWATGITCAICVVITLAAYRKADRDITRSDWFMFAAGLAALPLWLITDTPFWSILLVTLIDCSAFYPTFRKSWARPWGEDTFMYGFNLPRHVVTLAAISQFSFVTALYPAALLAMNLVMYVMLKARRRVLPKK